MAEMTKFSLSLELNVKMRKSSNWKWKVLELWYQILDAFSEKVNAALSVLVLFTKTTVVVKKLIR